MGWSPAERKPIEVTAISAMPVRIALPARAEKDASFSISDGLSPGGVGFVSMTLLFLSGLRRCVRLLRWRHHDFFVGVAARDQFRMREHVQRRLVVGRIYFDVSFPAAELLVVAYGHDQRVQRDVRKEASLGLRDRGRVR